MWTQFKHYNSSFVVEKSWQPKSRTRSVWKFLVTNPTSIDIQARRPREKLRAFFDNHLSPVAKEPSLSLSCFPDDFTFVLFFFLSLPFTLHLLALSRARLHLHPLYSMEVCLQVTSSCELIVRQKKLYIRELSRSRVLFVRKILFVGTKFLFKLLRFSFFKLTIW